MTNQLRRHWGLDPDIDFLNHGSFGACPTAVLEYQGDVRARLEREPVDFFSRQYGGLVDDAREALATFVGADPAGLAAVTNATSGVNAVLRSLELETGDELLTTNHAYNACSNALDFVARRARARVVTVAIPFPLAPGHDPTAALLAAATARTRLVLVDHIASATGLVFPVAEIVRAFAERGVDVLVDGAHAPGMLPVDVDGLGAAYYTGNCHKWLCAPKGAAFLWVREDRREMVRPLTISHGANRRRAGRSRFHDEFDWTGTHDPSAFLSVPRAIEFVGSLLDGGWPAVMRHNHELVVAGRGRLLAALEIAEPCTAEQLGSLAMLPLPDAPDDAPEPEPDGDPLRLALLERHKIEVPVFPWPGGGHRAFRISAQLYNDEAQYERLARALLSELGR